MKIKFVIGILVVVLAAAGIGYQVLHNRQAGSYENYTAPDSGTPSTPPSSGTNNTGGATGGPTATPTAPASSSTFTMADVAKHNSAKSCYTAINGNVYDLTKWIDQHPGGPDAILSICGGDGTAAFMGQHGANERAQKTLATFKIGTLAK